MKQREICLDDLKVLMALCQKAIDAKIDIFLELRTAIDGNKSFVITAQEKPNHPVMATYLIPKEGKDFESLLEEGGPLLMEYVKCAEKETSKFYHLVKTFKELTGLVF